MPRSGHLGIVLVFLVGCAASNPERQAHRERLSTAAHDCQKRYNFIERFEFDRFDLLTFWYRSAATAAERDLYLECYRLRVQELTKGAAAAGGGPRTTGGTGQVRDEGSAEAPIWQPGYEWTYRWESPAGSGTFVTSVERRGLVDGVDCYVLRVGGNEIYRRVSDLALVAERSPAGVVAQYTPALEIFRWPLVTGKAWDQLLVLERPQRRETVNILRTSRVWEAETTTTPAGSFRTVRVVVRNKHTDEIISEYWYGPQARQVVKFHARDGRDVTRYELVTFSLVEGRGPSTLLPAKRPAA